jgi:hypothetical protein
LKKELFKRQAFEASAEGLKMLVVTGAYIGLLERNRLEEP